MVSKLEDKRSTAIWLKTKDRIAFAVGFLSWGLSTIGMFFYVRGAGPLFQVMRAFMSVIAIVVVAANAQYLFRKHCNRKAVHISILVSLCIWAFSIICIGVLDDSPSVDLSTVSATSALLLIVSIPLTYALAVIARSARCRYMLQVGYILILLGISFGVHTYNVPRSSFETTGDKIYTAEEAREFYRQMIIGGYDQVFPMYESAKKKVEQQRYAQILLSVLTLALCLVGTGLLTAGLKREKSDSAAAAYTEPSKDTTLCPSCGAEVKLRDTYCGDCGQHL